MENELLEIEGITLLSTEEAEALPETIRACGDWWWLRSPGSNSSRAAFVNYGSSVRNYGDFVYNDFVAVRPALVIPDLESLGLEKFKDSIGVFGREWIYIGDSMALAEKPIFKSRFDEKSNDYGTSVIKQKLENWLEKQIEKYFGNDKIRIARGI